MERSGYNPELEIVGHAELKKLGIAMQNLLNQYGQAGVEHGVGQTLTYSCQLAEAYKLTDTVTEFAVAEQEVTIFSITRKTGMYEKGLYIAVFTDLTGDEDAEDTDSWYRHTEYGLLSNNQFYVYDDFVGYDYDGYPLTDKFKLRHESLGASNKRRHKEIVSIAKSLGPDFTLADYADVVALLDRFDPIYIET